PALVGVRRAEVGGEVERDPTDPYRAVWLGVGGVVLQRVQADLEVAEAVQAVRADLVPVEAPASVGPRSRRDRHGELVGSRDDRLPIVGAGEVRAVAQVLRALGEREAHAGVIRRRPGEAELRVADDDLAEVERDARRCGVRGHQRRPDLVDAGEIAFAARLILGHRDADLGCRDRARERHLTLYIRVAG